MDTYLTLLYLTLEQEIALKDFFLGKGWSYSKQDLSAFTDNVGPPASVDSTVTASQVGNTFQPVGRATPGSSSKPGPKSSKHGSAEQDVKSMKVILDDIRRDERVIKIERVDEFHDGQGDDAGGDFQNMDEDIDNDDHDDDDDFADTLEQGDDNDIDLHDDDEDDYFPDRISVTRSGRKSKRSPAVAAVTNAKRKAATMKSEEVVTPSKNTSSDQEAGPSTSSGSWRKRRRMTALTEAKEKAFAAEINDGEEGDDGKYSCDRCGRRFNHQSSLLRHVTGVHMEEKSHLCSECGKHFGLKEHLDEHMISHGDSKPNICAVCGKGFKHRQSLKRHTDVHNSDGRKFKCSICQKDFDRHDHLLTHLETHYPKQKCYRCGKEVFHLARHLIICRDGRVKQHECTECGTKFLEKRYLQEHCRSVHSVIKNFQCTICGAVFRYRATLYNHSKTCGK